LRFLFIDFQKTYSGRGFQVLGISFDDDGWKLVKPFIAAKRVNYPVMIGSSHVAALTAASRLCCQLSDR